MIMKTIQDRHVIFLSPNAIVPGNKTAQPFLKENERIAFDLQSRTLVFTTGDLAIGIVRFSPIDAHLMLALLSFYPHYVSDATLAIGYTTDLVTYYTYLESQAETRPLHASYPIADGIDRLKKKVASLGITIVRVRNTGYLLERCADLSSDRGGHGLSPMQFCER
jgi:hypothetical protein